MTLRGAAFGLLRCGVLGASSCARPRSTEPLFWRFELLLRSTTKEKRPPLGERFSLVNLRGPSAKHFWDRLEKFDERLEELGIGSKK